MPKSHKVNIPLKPTVSDVGSPTYKLAKCLASELSPILGKFSNCHLLNSEDFQHRCMNVNSNSKLLSLDVDSLYAVNETLNFSKKTATWAWFRYSRWNWYIHWINWSLHNYLSLMESFICKNMVWTWEAFSPHSFVLYLWNISNLNYCPLFPTSGGCGMLIYF